IHLLPAAIRRFEGPAASKGSARRPGRSEEGFSQERAGPAGRSDAGATERQERRAGGGGENAGRGDAGLAKLSDRPLRVVCSATSALVEVEGRCKGDPRR